LLTSPRDPLHLEFANQGNHLGQGPSYKVSSQSVRQRTLSSQQQHGCTLEEVATAIQVGVTVALTALSLTGCSTMARECSMIDIEINHATYRVHEALLLHHSDYFRKALQQCWKEGEERKVVLNDLEPKAFDVFVDWLYTQKLPEKREDWLPLKTNEELPSYLPSVDVLRLKVYVIADRLGARDLLHAINNKFVDDEIESAPYYNSIIYAFDNIPSGRRILNLLVDSHCANSEEADDAEFQGGQELHSQLPHDFLLQVMHRYRQKCEDREWDEDLVACDYHEHASGEERKECKKKAEKE